MAKSKRTLTSIFKSASEILLAMKVLECFESDYEKTKQPMSSNCDSLLAWVKEEWQELVDKSYIELSFVDKGYRYSRVIIKDVEYKLPAILGKLTNGGFLKKIRGGYIWNEGN